MVAETPSFSFPHMRKSTNRMSRRISFSPLLVPKETNALLFIPIITVTW